MTNKTLFISARDENINLILYSIQSAKTLGINKVVIRDDASAVPIAKNDIAPWVDIENIEIVRNTKRLGCSASRHLMLANVKDEDVCVIADAHVLVTKQRHNIETLTNSNVVGWLITPFINSGRVPTIAGVETPKIVTQPTNYTNAGKNACGPCTKFFAISGKNLKKIKGYAPLMQGEHLVDLWLALRCRAAKLPFALINEPVKHYNVCEGKPAADKLNEDWMLVYNHMTIADCAAYKTYNSGLQVYNWYRAYYNQEVCNKAMDYFNEKQQERELIKGLFIDNDMVLT
jgi:hypothetical protein